MVMQAFAMGVASLSDWPVKGPTDILLILAVLRALENGIDLSSDEEQQAAMDKVADFYMKDLYERERIIGDALSGRLKVRLNLLCTWHAVCLRV